ncbi:hypothetical protein [Xanthomonas axonopodis]
MKYTIEINATVQVAHYMTVEAVIPPPISRRQKWNFLVPFPEEVP